MNPKTLIRLIIAIWFSESLFFIVLFSLVTRYRICRTKIVDISCNNPATTKPLCDDTKLHHYFGLTFTRIIHVIPLVVMCTHDDVHIHPDLVDLCDDEAV